MYNIITAGLDITKKGIYKMNIDMKKTGELIAMLRTSAHLTQAQLGERIGVAYQSVSKWERGECLPDVSVLPDLASILGTTVDNLLMAGRMNSEYKGRISVSDAAEGIRCLKRMGELLGYDNIIYLNAVRGINEGMNTNVTDAFTDEHIFEVFVAEALLWSINGGYYVDLTDINRSFSSEKLRKLLTDAAKKHGIV